MSTPARRMKQQPLPLPDTRATAEHWRIAAATAEQTPYLTPAQREDARRHYLQQAEQIEAQRNDH